MLEPLPNGSSYDRNNWAETPESLEIKSKLAPEDVLIEGTSFETRQSPSVLH